MPLNFSSLLRGFMVLSLLAATSRAANGDDAPKPEVDPQHVEKIKAGLELFKTKVRGIFIEQCIACHGGDEVQSGFDLATRKGLMRGGSKGKAVVAGKPDDSRLIALISHNEDPHMPEGGDKLPDDVIAAVRQWIELGAPYDAPLVDHPRDPDAWVNREVPAKAREFWSFRPLVRHAPPAVKNEVWPKTPIDRFVLAKLEEKGLAPNPAIDRRLLIRRAYFDLVGLPPKSEEIEAFVNDTDPEAYSKLLDKLLSNSHFGERWGRYWLDTARFAESHGFEQDYDRPFAYHFRDFVIEALNQDMPYDQFVRWQLAGDELAPNDPLALKATGFLGAGVFPTQITANEVERSRYDALDDMAATTGTAFLGLTVGCARCHDHKFDPIPQADYYRFTSTFTTTVRSNIEVNLDPEKFKQQHAAWEAEHAPLVAQLEKFEKEQLPGKLAEWEATKAAEFRQATWRTLDVVEAKSASGATLAKQDDGSILATGKNPDFDTYTIVAKAPLKGVTAIRLEALAHPSLVKGGPGRADNGNIDLTSFRVVAKLPDGKELPLKLTNPKATFEQPNLYIRFAIDDDKKSGWAVDPQFGKDHAAVFELADTVTVDGECTLTFTLEFQGNNRHNIGRARLSLTTAAKPVGLEGQAVPGDIAAILDMPRDQRNAEQQAKLLQWYRHLDPAWQEANKPVAEHLAKEPKPQLTQMMVCSEGVTPIRHHTQGADFFNEFYFLKRGDVDQKQGLATQSFLQVLMTSPDREKHWLATPPEGSKLSYRRTALANWMTDAQQGAGHLLARVIVNRLWQGHFGQGIVSTANDFGAQGKPPTHPELLDWLALDLMENGWKMKRLHKLIMLSSAYQQATAARDDGLKLDPQNELLWRMSPQRLEAEVIRDALLAVSGQLDETMYGPGTLDEGHKRRSIYFTVKRSRLIPMMQLFDQPEPLVSVGNRPSTTIAPQALAFMNSPYVRGYALSFAAKLAPSAQKSPSDAVTLGYQTAIGRAPDAEELAASVAFIESQIASYREANKPNAQELALADFCQVLFGLNEFIYIE
jgi:mono/diheme cytochrome c family protein